MARVIKIAGENFNLIETFDKFLTVPDCVVDKTNKIGSGNGEKKFYIASKDEMRKFFNDGKEGFKVKCFVLKTDLLSYMDVIQSEYIHPSQNYRAKDEFPTLWNDRKRYIETLPEIIEFDMFDQTQIEGDRGYVNTAIRENRKIIERGISDGYNLITEIALPLVSYVSIMQLATPQGTPIYYWRLFVDFDAISEIANGALVLKYGKKEAAENAKKKKQNKLQEEISNARIGQGKYRDDLLLECPYCPITGINDERLLIASHIKPWVVCSNTEKVDAKNGFALSPMFDKLFDRGFITFTDDRHIMLSNWITPKNYERIGISDGTFYQRLPIDELRKVYLQYHRQFVFKG